MGFFDRTPPQTTTTQQPYDYAKYGMPTIGFAESGADYVKRLQGMGIPQADIDRYTSPPPGYHPGMSYQEIMALGGGGGGLFGGNNPRLTDPGGTQAFNPQRQTSGTQNFLPQRNTFGPNNIASDQGPYADASTMPTFTPDPNLTAKAWSSGQALNTQADPMALIQQWQSSHPPTADSARQMVAWLNQQGVPAAMATHAGGSAASDDKVVLPDGTYMDVLSNVGAPDSKWTSGISGHYDPSVNVVGPDGKMVPYGDFLQGRGLPVPQFTPRPGDGLPEYGAGGLPPGYQFNPSNQGIWAASGPGLAQAWMREFQAPSTLGNFNDPGYDARMKAGTDAIQRSAASKGSLLTGGTLKDLTQFSQDYASSEYDKVYNRRLGEYGMDRDSFFKNNSQLFGNLYNLSSLGENAAAQSGNFGQNYASGAAGDITAQGSAKGNAEIAKGNTWGGAFGNLGNIGQSSYFANLYNQ